jgi:hypothetical protein
MSFSRTSILTAVENLPTAVVASIHIIVYANIKKVLK